MPLGRERFPSAARNLTPRPVRRGSSRPDCRPAPPATTDLAGRWRPRLAELADYWWQAHGSKTRSQFGYLYPRVLEHLGEKRARDITPDIVDGFLDHLATDRKLSASRNSTSKSMSLDCSSKSSRVAEPNTSRRRTRYFWHNATSCSRRTVSIAVMTDIVPDMGLVDLALQQTQAAPVRRPPAHHLTPRPNRTTDSPEKISICRCACWHVVSTP